MIFLVLILAVIAFGALAMVLGWGFWIPAFLSFGALAVAVRDRYFSTNAIHRNFPLVGHLRDVAYEIRPMIHQYFVESDTDGTPFNSQQRHIIKQRSHQALDTQPFGTQLNVYNTGYEWMHHSIAALHSDQIEDEPRYVIGGPDCLKPYSCSILNVSAMSYGSLSKNAIAALNGGAAIGGFAHNTGEGGISDYHNQFHGDLIYQLGTGYFGARAEDGNFSPELFKQRTAADNVKMIELKLSQGAKPGHGGILPGKKVSAEISKIRNVPMGKDVLSPPYHKAFHTPVGLLKFIKQLRDLSGGKPVGFKLCIGHKYEFLAICKAMLETGIKPDFIAIDGGEGGTGAAPLEFSNSVGTPLKEGLAFAYDALIGCHLKKDITLIAAGKISSGFHMYRAMALGADVCYSARAMMMALGCIQALECNSNTCPVGVATNKPELMHGLVVKDKKERVAEYHHETVHAFWELLGASGLKKMHMINRSHIYRRIENNVSQSYDQIYPYIGAGALLTANDIPTDWKAHWMKADPHSFAPRFEEVFE